MTLSTIVTHHSPPYGERGWGWGFFLLPLLLYSLGSRQQSACSKDVLSTTCTYRCDDAMVVEIVAESLHLLLVATLEVYVRNLVEAYEVDTAEQTLG